MKLPRRQFLHLAAGAAALSAVSRFAWAQSYPTRPVRLIVGLAAGGKADEQTHRPRRISLRPRKPRHGRQRGSACGQMQKLSAGKFHGVPL